MIDDKLKDLINQFCEKNGISHWGTCLLENQKNTPVGTSYLSWLKAKMFGTMEYMKSSEQTRLDPVTTFSGMKSAIVFAFPYLPHPKPKKIFPGLQIAQYAQGEDYHYWITEKLGELILEIKSHYAKANFLTATDSKPLLERDLATRAGLGWVGKNTCVIHPKHGSFFFIAEILTDLYFDNPISLTHDFCGSCTRCLTACPTGALTAPRTLDARKCISYLTIETKEIPSEELQNKMENWFFGCDICQTVCPWNHKPLKIHPITPTVASEEVANLKEILESSGKQLDKKLWGSPLSRAGNFGLKKNALILVGQKKLKSLESSVEKLCEHPRLGSLAKQVREKLR